MFDGIPENAQQKQRRGFAAMSKELQRLLASKGGRSQGKGNNPANFANDPLRASIAGGKGGRSRRLSNA
jgi:general stress protein YciG